jgi:hypothetical protein
VRGGWNCAIGNSQVTDSAEVIPKLETDRTVMKNFVMATSLSIMIRWLRCVHVAARGWRPKK